MQLVFLDLDGVLLPTMFRDFVAQWARVSKGAVTASDELLDYFAPHCQYYLTQLLRESGAAIVFTTNRRGETDLTKVAAQRFGAQVPVLGSTPRLDYSKGYIRGDEIVHYLGAYEGPQLNGYVIVDDMGPEFFHHHQRRHLVQCDERWGFGKRELSRALEILAELAG